MVTSETIIKDPNTNYFDPDKITEYPSTNYFDSDAISEKTSTRWPSTAIPSRPWDPQASSAIHSDPGTIVEVRKDEDLSSSTQSTGV